MTPPPKELFLSLAKVFLTTLSAHLPGLTSCSSQMLYLLPCNWSHLLSWIVLPYFGFL